MATSPNGKASEPSIDERYAKQACGEDPLIDLFTSGRGSDCTIKCQGREWKLHTNILSARCSYFLATFDGNFQEAASKDVILNENDPEILDIVLRHLYVRYEKLPYEYSMTHSALAQLALKVAVVADQFGVPALLDMAIDMLRTIIEPKSWRKKTEVVDCIMNVIVPGLFSEPVCAALEMFKELMPKSIATLFERNHNDRDQISEVLCQYPVLNKQVMVELMSGS